MIFESVYIICNMQGFLLVAEGWGRRETLGTLAEQPEVERNL